MNFEELKNNLEYATKQAFIEMFEKYGEEKIYAFALYSDENAMTVCPSTNTLKHLSRLDSNCEDFTYYKFEPAEWKYEMQGADKLFSDISRLCSDEISEMEEDDDIYDREFDKFQKKLYDMCIEVLKKLKSENFFKQIVGEDIFLTFTVSEYEFNKKDLKEIITQLNENEYKQEYLNWMQTWQEDV